uniref:dihydrofolate reductase n=2 Tax=Arion vulgaris TaxID=1028688 RepID=A0A0B7BSG5_9EUPU
MALTSFRALKLVGFWKTLSPKHRDTTNSNKTERHHYQQQSRGAPIIATQLLLQKQQLSTIGTEFSNMKPDLKSAVDSKIIIASVAAFCHGNRGIGKDGGLPWPHIREDHEFYTGLCKTTKDPNKKNGIIMGRNGWDTWNMENKNDPKMSTVVTSTSLSKDEPHCRGVARNFDEAVRMFYDAPDRHEIETIYILGGRINYEHGVTDPRCTRHIVTRILQNFESDVFFPDFEHTFRQVSHPEIDDRIRQDPTNGIQFRFEVWEKHPSDYVS